MNSIRTHLMFATVLAVATWMTSAHAAFAQSDIAGSWSQPGGGTVIGPGNARTFGFEEDTTERATGPAIADFLGIPINDEGRARGLSYDGSLLTVPEHQCMPHPSTYSFWGPVQLKIAEELDDNLNLVAYHVGGTFRRADRTIYMDGRPHPSDIAPHTWAGFTTGKWVGNTLVTTTTHLKWAWIRRNGTPSSDEAIVTTFYTRNDNYMTITWMVHDPLYLTETYTKSTDFILSPQPIASAQFDADIAGQGGGSFFKCLPSEEVIRADPFFVPNYLPWANPFTDEVANKLHIPEAATLGGAETAYPEYRAKLRQVK
jgi:hypothetical protein